VKDPR